MKKIADDTFKVAIVRPPVIYERAVWGITRCLGKSH